MVLNQPVLEGSIQDQYSILNQGVWRWPAGSTPDKGGNTVLLAHRFSYTNPRGAFYFLNKLQIGDEIGLLGNQHHYIYRVDTINEVPPTETSIEDASTNAKLTLFTCTPLWLPKNHLVVTANLEQVL